MKRKQKFAAIAIVVCIFGTIFVPVLDVDGDGVAPFNEILSGTDPLDGDTDNDGLGDGVELQSGTDPTDPDTDDDGLKDGTEAELGTDPTTADTDDDGVNDQTEYQRDIDPTEADSDNDGLNDGVELRLNTSPTKADTDGDGLDDKKERQLETDPTEADTDNDGLNDGKEVEVGSDPLTKDTDDDGLSDGREVEFDADPLIADTDYDGVNDGREVELGMDPAKADTDGDGLLDSEELEQGTNPAKADTDSDGVADAQELQDLTNVTNPDTDGDNLADGWEKAGETPGGLPLPDANPRQMDIYVTVYTTEGHSLSPTVKEQVRENFRDMQVINPNYKSGIRVHFVQSESLDMEAGLPAEEYHRKIRKLSAAETELPIYHSVVVTEFADSTANMLDPLNTAKTTGLSARNSTPETRNYGASQPWNGSFTTTVLGKGATPGYFTVIKNGQDGTASTVLTHELLHNVVGQRTGEECGTAHTCSGWLAPQISDTTESLPESVQELLRDEGFAPDRFEPVSVEPPFNKTENRTSHNS
ncbi:hypothetical protein [Salinibaculum rarum]|uniref:hypothetical protein n=1 Tax=Salinibaculum rarum TaxID=3058903 RepID=UPI00265F4E06|nr:hypothetical protein [Salinibaculum sp. KK48]